MVAVDCIDCAADASVVSAVNEGIEAARDILCIRRPWVMISVNDDKDLHFRKAGRAISSMELHCCICVFYVLYFSNSIGQKSCDIV